MKLGFITEYSEERVVFAGGGGFDGLEVSLDMGGPLDLRSLAEGDISRILRICGTNRIQFLTVQCCPNHLAADPGERRENNEYFLKALKVCKKLGTDVVMTNAWADRDKSPAENVKIFGEAFGRYAEAAEAEGVRIAIENCPHWLGYPRKVGNIAFSPEMWDALFEAVPSGRLGLEFDPSHLVWQGIDYLRAIKDYGERIFAVHAKDTEILRDQKGRCGIIGKQFGTASEWDSGWWRYRIPGWGEVDWPGVFRGLYDAGFDGPVVIEHEDPVFSGPLTDMGLKKGLAFLRQFIL